MAQKTFLKECTCKSLRRKPPPWALWFVATNPGPAAALAEGQHRGNPWHSNILQTSLNLCVFVCTRTQVCLMTQRGGEKHVGPIRKSPFVLFSVQLAENSVAKEEIKKQFLQCSWDL